MRKKEKIPGTTVGQVGVFTGAAFIYYVSYGAEEHSSNEIVFWIGWIGIALIAYSVLVGGGVFIWGMVASAAERRMMSAEARSSSKSRGPRDSAEDGELRARFRRESEETLAEIRSRRGSADKANNASIPPMR